MTRTLLPTVLMFLLGALVAGVALTAYVRVAHAAPEMIGAWSPVPLPDGHTRASALPDASTAASALPAPAEPQRDPWRTGAPLAAILVGVAALGFAGSRRDPRRAWLWAAVAFGALIAADSLRTGETPSLEMLLAPGAVLAAGVMPGTMRQRAQTVRDPIAVPEHIPEGDTDRDPERGAAHASLLIWQTSLMILGWLTSFVLLAAGAGIASCATARTAGGIVTDCAVAVAPAELERARPVVEAAIANAMRPDGSIDVAPLLDVARTMSVAVGGCTLAEALSRAMAPTFAPRTQAGPTPEQRAWAAVQARQYPGRSFRLASGAVL